MMPLSDVSLSAVSLTDTAGDVMRNITSIRVSQDLFDDLSDTPRDWALAQKVEGDIKPPTFQSVTPLIHRPFETADWDNAIGYPFKHWQQSRYSDGTFGVWYGSDSVTTTVYETVHHWLNGIITDAGWREPKEPIITERKVYRVHCQAALLDLRHILPNYPQLMHPSDYSAAQNLGARLQREGHPGCITGSARYAKGHNTVVFNPNILSQPRHECLLTYRFIGQGQPVLVEKTQGKVWMRIDHCIGA